jgi:hypothetical protein
MILNYQNVNFGLIFKVNLFRIFLFMFVLN